MSLQTMTDMPLEPAGVPRGRAMVERADWAARAFARFDAATVHRIAKAAAKAGAASARRFAEEAVAETGFGVAEHKYLKNIACSSGLWTMYGDEDFVSPRVLDGRKIVEIPRPAGVVLALTPSTNPVATTYFKILACLSGRLGDAMHGRGVETCEGSRCPVSTLDHRAAAWDSSRLQRHVGHRLQAHRRPLFAPIASWHALPIATSVRSSSSSASSGFMRMPGLNWST